MNIEIKNKQSFTNPILPGFYPDPSICRVGEDYYMVNSSFAFFPGIPIFTSKDLVNWEQIGHVMDREEQFNLDGARYSEGIFAPTIRHHEGMFYVITTNVNHGGNFIVTAKDPKGPWSDPHFINGAEGIDPSLFFDDNGKVYYTGSRGPKESQYNGDTDIWLQQIDLNTMELKGESHIIWKGALKKAYYAEGPHIYKINGFYYLVIAEGGTEQNHSVTIARSKNILGPYEGNPANPILTHRHLGKAYPISNVGHADLVETQNGEWYMVALGSRPYGGYYKNLGRETFLVPMIWEDGWPIVSPGTGKVEFTYPMPNLPVSKVREVEVSDDFDKDVLDYKWNFIRTPREKFWSLTERAGYLRLRLRPVGIVDNLNNVQVNSQKGCNREAPSFVGRRQQHIAFEACTKMEFNPQSEYETAGIALVQNNNHQLRIEYTIENGHKVVRLIKCTAKFHSNFQAENIETELASKVFDSKVIYLKVTAVGQDYNFYYGSSMNAMEVLLEKVDGRVLSWEEAGGFIGTYIGLFASSNGKTSNNAADFDWVKYNAK